MYLFMVYVTFKQSTFAHANRCRKTPLEIHFIYLGKKKIY